MPLTKTEVDRILDALDEGFMRPEVWQEDVWEVSANQGETQYVPCSVAGSNPSGLAEYVDGTIDTNDQGEPIATVRPAVWCARLSASGYMDATDLAIFDSEEEARAYLAETYGDDLDLEDEEPEPPEDSEPQEGDRYPRAAKYYRQ